VSALLRTLERLAGGDTDARVDVSPLHDELDAIAFGINVVADEWRWANRKMTDAERQRAEALRRSKEEAERANESKSVFLRNASHEIRTPIAVINVITELLSMPDLSDEDRADLVAKLRANSQAVLTLVGSLLDLSRLEAGKVRTVVEPVSPLGLVNEVVESLEPQARKKGLAVQIESEGRVPLAIATDEQRLRQILVNVVGNALKFTERGGVRIMMSAPSSNGTLLHFDVADTGLGISPEGQRSLFEPFEQADALVPLVHSGTGLGLSIARRLAEQLGGSLTLLHSQLDHGSTFRLTIPATPAQRSATRTVIAAPTSPRRLPGTRILLAEDNEDLQVALQRLLQAAGATVESAHDGRAAISKAMAGRFDVVLMDILMPRVNGLEAIRTLRARGCDVPIIALTGDSTTASRLASLDAGYTVLLSKPFDPDQLIESIWQLLTERYDQPDDGRRAAEEPAPMRGHDR
jgi:signal transduction histidine kinase/CheY-like chemotaxis protein